MKFPTLLRNRDFFRLWLSNGLWWNAGWVELIVLGWLALELTDSPWQVAMVGLVRALPMLLGFFTSWITDHFRRRKLLVVLQGAVLLGLGTLAALYGFGALRYWHIVAVSLLHGMIFTLDWPTRRALFPDLVGRENVIDAMMIDNMNLGVAWCIGSLAGGGLLYWVGAGGALCFSMVLGCSSLVLLLSLKTNSVAPSRPAGWSDNLQRLRDGLRYVRRKPRIRGVLLVTVLMNAYVFPVHALMPVFARDILGSGPLGLGILSGAHGIGILIGLVAVRRGRRHLPDTWLFAAGCLLGSAAFLGFSFSTHYGLSLALVLIAGMGHSGFGTMQSGIILTDTNDEMRGRAMAALVLAIGGGPLGSLQSTGMVASLGAPLTVAVMAFSAMVGILAVILLLPGFVRRNRTPQS
jgi:Na+/melibiose symporter-like transporter